MKKKNISRNLKLKLIMKKKLSSTLIVMTLTLVFLSMISMNSYTSITSEDNNLIDDLIGPKTSYFNLNMNPIVINGSATGVGAQNWSWAADQEWCTNKSGILYLENLTINAGGAGSCIEITDSYERFVIRNCTLYNSGSNPRDSGIKLAGASLGVITENNISSNNVGITLMNNVTYNNITKNMIVNNAGYGILIVNDTAQSLSTGNFIYRNNFTGNGIHALDNCSYSEPYVNIWYDKFFKGVKDIAGPGNYWDNYTELGAGAVDADDDGIGDIPYTIPGIGSEKDKYPIWQDGYNGSVILIDDSAQDTHVTWEWAATLDWCHGSGTEADPYTIDKLVIDANNNADGIKIQNSNKHFKITNCTVFNTSSTGIKLHAVNMGQVIDNNCSYTNVNGIYLIDCSSITLSENELLNNSGNGIAVENSNNTVINDNNMTYNKNGMGIYGSHNSILRNTILLNDYNGMTISFGKNNTIRENTVNKNTLYGIQLSSSSINNTIENNTASFNQIGIFIDGSDYNNILNNTAKNNTVAGISVTDSNSNEIYGNKLNYNDVYGIALSSISNNNTIDSNNVSLNGIGIALVNSNYNTLLNNTSNNNTQYGIYLQSSNYNNVSGNSVIGNGVWCIRQYNCIVGSNHFEYNGNCTVQTENDQDDEPPSNGGTTPPFIPGYDLIFLIGTMCLISMLIIKKKRK